MTTLSFEVFPPKSMAGAFRLWDAIRALEPLAPEFVSVTYGAGGGTRDRTLEAAKAIARQTELTVAAHLTCVGDTRDETRATARDFAEAGITEVVALRGDPPGGGAFEAHPEGFPDACALIADLARTHDFAIRVAAYPDPHPDAADEHADVAWLKQKLAAGGSSAITQFFFEAESFLRFRDRCAEAGIDAPILPGLLPIASWPGVSKFAGQCGIPIPAWLSDGFEAAGEDGAQALARDLATEMAARLLAEGVEHLHFYTMNKSPLTRDVVHALGLAPAPALSRVA